MKAIRRFEDELSILRGLLELRRRGVALRDLETELTKMGVVDIDILYGVMDRLFSRLEGEYAPQVPMQPPPPAGVLSLPA